MPTPVFNIPFPTGATKARDLPAALETMALGVEAALLAAGTNPATTAAIVSAPSAAARDLQWGVPATAAERLALQAIGATTLRTDKGWAERYYAGSTDGGANPGGSTVAGWYPVSGNLPGGVVCIVPESPPSYSIPASAWLLLTDPARWQPLRAAHGGVQAFNGTWVVPFAGVWEVSAAFNIDTAVSAFISVKKNDTTLNMSAAVTAASSTGYAGVTVLAASQQVTLAAGDVLRAAIYASTACKIQNLPVYRDLNTFGIRFVEPARS